MSDDQSALAATVKTTVDPRYLALQAGGFEQSQLWALCSALGIDPFGADEQVRAGLTNGPGNTSVARQSGKPGSGTIPASSPAGAAGRAEAERRFGTPSS